MSAATCLTLTCDWKEVDANCEIKEVFADRENGGVTAEAYSLAQVEGGWLFLQEPVRHFCPHHKKVWTLNGGRL